MTTQRDAVASILAVALLAAAVAEGLTLESLKATDETLNVLLIEEDETEVV